MDDYIAPRWTDRLYDRSGFSGKNGCSTWVCHNSFHFYLPNFTYTGAGKLRRPSIDGILYTLCENDTLFSKKLRQYQAGIWITLNNLQSKQKEFKSAQVNTTHWVDNIRTDNTAATGRLHASIQESTVVADKQRDAYSSVVRSEDDSEASMISKSYRTQLICMPS